MTGSVTDPVSSASTPRSGSGPLAVAALMVLHVVVATAGVLAYRRVLPLPAS